MIAMGFEKVYALEGGWQLWEDLGYPVEPK
jgi:3-mercaptopyruvate sulfurtransferase SseA